MDSPGRHELMAHAARCGACRNALLAARSKTRAIPAAVALTLIALLSFPIAHQHASVARGVSTRAHGIEALEDALRRETGQEQIGFAIEHSVHSALLVDLARTYLTRDSDAQSIPHRLQGFAAANRAWNVDPSNRDALLHRTLALQKLGLQSKQPRSRWAVEAAILKPYGFSETVLNDSQSARGHAEDELLPEWGRLHLGGDIARAAEILQKANRIAQLLTRVTNDRMLEDQIARITDPAWTDRAAEAHVAYGVARRAFRKSPNDTALEPLQRAIEQLSSIGSPLRHRAAMYVATVDQYGGRNMVASRAVARLLQEIETKKNHYPSLTGQLEWTAGLCSFSRGDYEQALAHYRTARASFLVNQDFSNLAGVAAVTAECLRFLGYDEEAWMEMLRALDYSSHYASRQRRYLVVSECMRLASEHHYLGIARHFSDLARVAARESGDPVLECDAFLSRAKLERTAGNPVAAIRSANGAERILASIPDSGMRKRLSCRIGIEKGASLAAADPRAALQALSNAEELARDIELAVYQPEVHQRRSEAFVALGNRDAAIAELRSGIRVHADLAPNQNPTDRATFARVGRELTDRLIALTIDADENGAWAAAMAARDHAAIPTLPEDDATALIAYHVLADELLIWILRQDGRFLVRQRIASTKLNDDVRAFVRAVGRAETLAAMDAESQRLYDQVARPALPHLAGVTRVQLLPDAVLNDVPFSILSDKVSGRRWLEMWESSILAPVLRKASKPPFRPDHATLFIAAAPDVRSLSPLPGALEEGKRLAVQWPQSSLLTGADSTPAAFLRGALSHDVVHFAGHVTHHHDPNLAALRLASEENGDGRLKGSDLDELSTRPPSLVVLSSCAAATGRPTALGPLSVVRPILDAGVPTVVASLWNVDDGSTAPLMLRFYAQLQLGRNPAAALREAQLSHRKLAPRHWAGFQVYVNQQFP